jgi:type IV secretory pathway TrbF-like protein
MTDDQLLAVNSASRRHFAEYFGLGRGNIWTMRGLTVLTTCWALAASGWAWREQRVSADRVERYVIYLDATSTPVGKVGIGAGWTPVTGTYLDFAKRWVLYLRGRPQDINTLKYQRGEVIKATDRKVYQQLQASMKAADDQVQTAAVDIGEISPILLEEGDNEARVAVRWRETVRNAGAKPTVWIATLKITYIEPKVRLEFERNLLGLYVTEFQFTQES